MIDFIYDRSENSYRVELKDFNSLTPEDLPLKLEFRRVVDNHLGWSSDLHPKGWAKWKGGAEYYHVYVYSQTGRLILKRLFDIAVDGNMIERTFHFFIDGLNFRPRGLVIGPHDGTFGHWVYPVLQDKSDVIFVEGTKSHIKTLKKNYTHLSKAKYIHNIVTPDGGEVDWYEGDKGFTNTVNRAVIEKFLLPEQITFEKRQSISINDLIKKESDINRMGPAFDWMHIDVEGIDCSLVYSLEYQPSLIIFETEHATRRDYFKALDWMQANDYRLLRDGNDAIAIKNNYFNPKYEEEKV